MYLTQMHLNSARRGAARLLQSPQRMHAAVMNGFAPGAETKSCAGRVLWRVDRLKDRTTLYVSSPGRPDLTHVVEQAGWPTGGDPWRTVDTSPFNERLAVGQAWHFRLTANPVKSLRSDTGGRGKVAPHVTAQRQEEWFRSRASGVGIELADAALVERRTLKFARHTDRPGQQVTVATATFEGTLGVTDPDALRHALTHGVGRAKSYGCGLMTLAPAR
ncbi:type I-E CRISPR-associated protein Cas6/Cse3/CasE [Nocardioides acrostichi]|uniref:Type I-E CRISPR-associated protein Cas6/Cse3/CasE n=1 Tax=Nocardioides acrostichi TaxID=2784339 RepID=A0A930UZQ5_9ACTN|nr:type I-E CRISPR-associated protein Cas6/Cse3/CasE [Nocardioides acrostichi]MBF4163031.1 type I-E CRISPR-associated protein Cas6/Cse3/CasE [Nocardioides acrostichi]